MTDLTYLDTWWPLIFRTFSRSCTNFTTGHDQIDRAHQYKYVPSKPGAFDRSSDGERFQPLDDSQISQPGRDFLNECSRQDPPSSTTWFGVGGACSSPVPFCIRFNVDHKQSPLAKYPESVPQTGENAGQYEYRDADFWTCGFFPGSIYALLERAVKFPSHLSVPDWYRVAVYDDLQQCGRHWSVALKHLSGRTDSHDLGFQSLPALQKDWELTGNLESRQHVINSAHALATRYSADIGAIRSWDDAVNSRYRLVDKEENFLVIIDSMCNLDLLYYVAHLTHEPSLAAIATTHAHTVRRTILREDYSSVHLVNFDPKKPGSVKARMTNQGYQDSSTWSRGQSWAIMGFAQTYMWTGEEVFLDTAIKCADMFLSRLAMADGKHHHPFVPAWDFDAPHTDPVEPLRDSSAGVIAANGLLLIHQAIQSLPGSAREAKLSGRLYNTGDFLDAALRIVKDTLDMSLDRDFASLTPASRANKKGVNGTNANSDVRDVDLSGLRAQILPSGFEAILRNATVNNNEHSLRRYSDHGLVYADYYLLEFGNKLCRMGLF